MLVCTCTPLSVGGAKSLDEDCAEHGIGTAYYDTVIVPQVRFANELQALARTARAQYAQGHAAALAEVAAWHAERDAAMKAAADASRAAGDLDLASVQLQTAIVHSICSAAVRDGRAKPGGGK